MYYSDDIRGRVDPHDNYDGQTVVLLLYIPYPVLALLSYRLSIFNEDVTRSVICISSSSSLYFLLFNCILFVSFNLSYICYCNF